MQKTETFFKTTADRLEEIHNALFAYEARLTALAYEAQDVSELQKKGLPKDKREVKFETELNAFITELAEFTDGSVAYWNAVREDLRSFNKYQMDNMYSLYIKAFNLKARDISKEIDKLDTTAVFFRKNLKGLNIKADVWVLDRALGDLNNLITKILFNARELDRVIETKTGSVY